MKMRLGIKIGVGFGCLILIACILGGIAVVRMSGVSTISMMLAHEYVPEVDTAYDLDRYSRDTMYAMRGYGLTGDQAYLNEGLKNLEEVKKAVVITEKLSKKSAHLVKLKTQLKVIEEHVNEYEELVGKTEALSKDMVIDRNSLDENAKIYIETCNTFLTAQNEAMKKGIESGAAVNKLQELLKKITLVNDIIDLGNGVRLANWKAQAERSVDQAMQALNFFDKMNVKFGDLTALTHDNLGIEEIKRTQEAARGYKKAMLGVIENWKGLDQLGTKRNETGDTVTRATFNTIMAGLAGSDRIAKQAVQSLGSASTIMIWGLIAALIIGVLIAYYITRSITQPIGKTVAMLKQMSEGDISGRLKMDNHDEIGQMAEAMDVMADSLTGMMTEIDGGVNTLSSSSTEMATIADQMALGSNTTVSKSNTVAAAAEEMNSNMTSVAAAMEQASTNVSTVASGAEQMSASISEIAINTAKASDSTRNAVERSKKASVQVDELGKAAEEIEVVTETIKAISDKTNLLALNATIEAARAGEAGKGFAVVANEIKDLAQQTAGATGDIAGKLQGIQQSTSMTVSEIEEVSTAIGQVDEIVNAIAAAVEEQNAATKDISENVGQVSMGLQEVNENVNQSSAAAGQVAKEITEVNEAANEMSNSSAQVQQSAGDLSKLSEQLKELVGQFKL